MLTGSYGGGGGRASESSAWPPAPQGWLRRRATVADRALLAVLGTARTHQQSFALFLGLVLGMAVLTVGVFVVTAPRPPERP